MRPASLRKEGRVELGEPEEKTSPRGTGGSFKLNLSSVGARYGVLFFSEPRDVSVAKAQRTKRNRSSSRLSRDAASSALRAARMAAPPSSRSPDCPRSRPMVSTTGGGTGEGHLPKASFSDGRSMWSFPSWGTTSAHARRARRRCPPRSAPRSARGESGQRGSDAGGSARPRRGSPYGS